MALDLRASWVAVVLTIGCALDERHFPVAAPASDAGSAASDTFANDAEAQPTSPEGQLGGPGNIAEPRIVSASPGEVDLGPLPTGQAAPPIEWTLTNGSPNTLSGLQLTGEALPLFQVSNGCGDELRPGDSCVVVLTYVPTFMGDQAPTVVMTWLGGEVRLRVRARGLPWVSVTLEGDGRVTSTPLGIDCPGTCRAPFDIDLEVTLQASPAPGTRIGGWLGYGCDGPVASCTLPPPGFAQPLQREVELRFFTPVNNLVFVSSESFSPVLGGTAPYDAACNRLATAAGINNGDGTGYVAAISDSNSFFWDRLAPGVRGWQRMDGLAFADTITDLVDLGVVYHPVAFDELGGRVGANVIGRPSLSGVTFDGTLGQHCSNWASTDGELQYGSPFLQGPGGLLGGWEFSTLPCDAASEWSITCLGNTSTVPLQRQISAGKRIWVTNTRIEIGSMTPDEACQAQRPSGVAQANALLAYTRRAAAAVLDPEANYIRPDGTLVGSGALLVDALRPEPARRVNSGIWQSADGTYLLEGSQSVSAWSGALDLLSRGTPETTCNDWTTTEGEGAWGRIPYASEGLWSWAGPASCVTANFFYCVEI